MVLIYFDIKILLSCLLDIEIKVWSFIGRIFAWSYFAFIFGLKKFPTKLLINDEQLLIKTHID
jgi:hypothetical protein